ncbi:3526_t:CDS:1, partial [Ambispora gerdemannii]
EAINDQEELKKYDAKTKKYQHFTGLLNKPEEKNIEEIEEDVLDQIERKKGLKEDKKLPRI